MPKKKILKSSLQPRILILVVLSAVGIVAVLWLLAQKFNLKYQSNSDISPVVTSSTLSVDPTVPYRAENDYVEYKMTEAFVVMRIPDKYLDAGVSGEIKIGVELFNQKDVHQRELTLITIKGTRYYIRFMGGNDGLSCRDPRCTNTRMEFADGNSITVLRDVNGEIYALSRTDFIFDDYGIESTEIVSDENQSFPEESALMWNEILGTIKVVTN